MKRIFRLSCAFYFLIGITSVMLGALLPVILPHYQRSYSDGGTLLFLQFIGFLAGVLISPALSAGVGRKRLLLIALTAITLAYAVMGTLPAWGLMVLMTIFVGFGSGIIESSIGAFTIEFAEEQKAVAMTKLDVYFGVGSMLLPALASLYIYLGVWNLSFYTVALSTFILLLFWMRMPADSSAHLHQDQVKTDQTETPAKPKYQSGQFKVLSIFVLFFFVYMGIELGMMNFLPSILIESIGISDSAASLSVTFFWGAITIGRLFVGRMAESMSYAPFLIGSTIASMLLIVALALFSSPIMMYVLIFGVGFCISGLFSIALVFANTLMPGMVERTTSTLIAAGGIGGSVLQYLIGWSMDHWSVRPTLWIFALFALVLLISIVLVQQLRTGNAAVRAGMESKY
ncbi:MFS transporter [Paenibacillus hunanensis]|uniref:MFS transporter n=1 Tax=Paenibacillus hunanensis TaxID=539262 RepID=UPI002A6B09BA|nr:MFS transporter [Paenibacillus hunanensis]WPP39997.1 MFS transporter [Paenibacillus hunanensis]